MNISTLNIKSFTIDLCNITINIVGYFSLLKLKKLKLKLS